MLSIELVPDLSHCVETVAKKEFQETLQRILSAEEVSDQLKDKAEILRFFLETADFRNLRAESESHLQRGEKVKYIVYLENGIAKYEIVTDWQPC